MAVVQALAQSRVVGDRKGCIEVTGGPEASESNKEAAGQNWVAAQALIWSSGKLAEAPAGVITQLAGIATEDATGDEDSTVSMIAAVPGLRFLAQLYDSTPEVSAITMRGQYFNLIVDASGYYHVDTENAVDLTKTCGHVIAFANEKGQQNKGLGDTNGWCIFELDAI